MIIVESGSRPTDQDHNFQEARILRRRVARAWSRRLPPWPPGVVVDGVRSRWHLPLGLRAETRRAQVLLRALHAGAGENPGQERNHQKKAAFSWP